MIKYENVSVIFEDVTALNNINLHIKNGDYVHILGPNGGGKTTIIKIMAGLLKPTHGNVKLDFKKIGYLPQHFRSKKGFPATVFEVIYTGFTKQYLIPKKEQKQLINKWLKIMGIEGLLHKKISDLSGGQQQRVFLVRALIKEPDLLILDEPTSALDPDFREKFYKLLNGLNDSGTTILNITHDLNKDFAKCEHKVIYVDQEIKFNGKYCDYRTKYQDSEHHHV